MRFDVFCEAQKPAPFAPDHEERLFRETLEQARFADDSGFDCWWSVEHHGAVEFSYSAAPEMLLGWIATQTKRIHLGHAGVLAPFNINHPIRAAERAAMLDHISGGRAELGLARTGAGEWDTFAVDAETSRQQLVEAMHMIPRMWTQDVFEWDSDLLRIPKRNIIPKPIQRPHPRLWQTCGSPESFRLAGRMGVGCLGTTLLTGLEQMEVLLDEYRQGLEEATDPAGQVRNEEAGVFTFVHVAESEKAAVESGAALGALWYVNAASRVFQAPPEIWFSQIRGAFLPNDPSAQRSLARGNEFFEGPDIPIEQEHPVVALLKRHASGEAISNEEAFETLREVPSVIVGDPESCRRKIAAYREIGASRLMCLFQYGHLRHDQILDAMGCLSRHVMPEFAG